MREVYWPKIRWLFVGNLFAAYLQNVWMENKRDSVNQPCNLNLIPKDRPFIPLRISVLGIYPFAGPSLCRLTFRTGVTFCVLKYAKNTPVPQAICRLANAVKFGRQGLLWKRYRRYLGSSCTHYSQFIPIIPSFTRYSEKKISRLKLAIAYFNPDLQHVYISSRNCAVPSNRIVLPITDFWLNRGTTFCPLTFLVIKMSIFTSFCPSESTIVIKNKKKNIQSTKNAYFLTKKQGAWKDGKIRFKNLIFPSVFSPWDVSIGWTTLVR